MNYFSKLLASVAVISGLCLTAHGHGDPNEPRVAIESESSADVNNKRVLYRFQLVDTAANKLIKDSDLVVSHEKKLHFIVYDPSLREFQHVHPNFDQGLWQVELGFNVSGSYWLWAQGKLTDGTEFSSSTRLKVALAGIPAWPTPVKLKELRTGNDGVSVATLDKQILKAGKMAMMTITLSRSDSSKPELAPYLGAFAHVIGVTDDADTLIHVHPMDSSNPDQGMLHVSFPTKGFYRIWVQFSDGAQIKTVPLAVHVN